MNEQLTTPKVKEEVLSEAAGDLIDAFAERVGCFRSMIDATGMHRLKKRGDAAGLASTKAYEEGEKQRHNNAELMHRQRAAKDKYMYLVETDEEYENFREMIGSFAISWFLFGMSKAVQESLLDVEDDEMDYGNEDDGYVSGDGTDVNAYADGQFAFSEYAYEYLKRGVGDYAEILEMYRHGQLPDDQSSAHVYGPKFDGALRVALGGDVDDLFKATASLRGDLLDELGITEADILNKLRKEFE